MKTCPYCAEEIQDAAAVCKHCGRELVARTIATAPRTRYVRKVMTGLLGGVALIALLAIGVAMTSDDHEPLLAVSAGRGVGGFELTNREPRAIGPCEVRLLDQGDAEWIAGLGQQIAPSQTVQVPWTMFYRDGQSVPAYIAMGRKYFSISCAVEGSSAMHTAGVSF